MGVINITPNSFSDGGQFNQKNNFEKKLLDSLAFDIIDIGAESTAPSNDEISFESEIERWQSIALPIIEKHQNKMTLLSVDTYKAETMKFILDWAEERKISLELIWNDVSGVLDSKTLSLLSDYPKLSYVLSYTHILDKAETQNHMGFLKEGSLLSSCLGFIKESKKKLEGLNNRIFFDPCFGFSKKREQNYELLQNLEAIYNEWRGELLIGVSRKSFTHLAKKNLAHSEILHSLFLNQLLESRMDHLTIRLHDKEILNILSFFQDHLKWKE